MPLTTIRLRGALAILLLFGVCAGAMVVALPAAPAEATIWPPTAAGQSARAVLDQNLPDADGDAIPDIVEQRICGSLTCAIGTEDADGDRIPDWVELMACETARCAKPGADADGDGIPDYAELLVCGTRICASGREDADRDGVADWVEFVICGTRTCADGYEDYDGNGVSDADELMGRVEYLANLEKTGASATWWWLTPAAVLALLAGIALVLRRRIARSPHPMTLISANLGGAR